MAPITRNKSSEGLFKVRLFSFEDWLCLGSSTLKRRTIALLLVLPVIAGCTTMTAYEGPKLPKDQIAILDATRVKGFWLVGGSNIYIASIDEKPAGTVTTNIELLPGLHTVRLVYSVCSMSGGWSAGCFGKYYRGSVQFSAEPGHVYEVDGETQDNQLRSWIKDKDTGQVVAEQTQPSSVEVIRAYEGPGLSRKEIAVIKGSHHRKKDWGTATPIFEGASIGSIDGKWEVAEHWPDFVEVEVLAGLHNVSVTSHHNNVSRAGYRVNLEFTAEPGHTYQADSDVPRRSSGPARFWIEDANTEQVVAEIYCSRQAGNDEQLAACTR